MIDGMRGLSLKKMFAMSGQDAPEGLEEALANAMAGHEIT